MDAVAYLKAYNRMCESFDSKNNIARKPCVGCPLDDIGRGCHMNDIANNAEECVAAVEKWAKEHPVITRQNKLLNLFPLMDAIEDGCIEICPLLFDRSFHDRNDRGWCTENDNKVCPECKRRFWMEELKEGET
mgnify:CR=1 FL=1